MQLIQFLSVISRLQNCNITDEGAVCVTSSLGSNPSHLRELDLSDNRLGDEGSESLSSLVKEPHCKLERMKYVGFVYRNK